jgi:hypothetical protein
MSLFLLIDLFLSIPYAIWYMLVRACKDKVSLMIVPFCMGVVFCLVWQIYVHRKQRNRMNQWRRDASSSPRVYS